MLHEPSVNPPEVQQELAANVREMRREGMRLLFWRSAAWTAFIPVTAWVGDAHSPLAGVMAGALLPPPCLRPAAAELTFLPSLASLGARAHESPIAPPIEVAPAPWSGCVFGGILRRSRPAASQGASRGDGRPPAAALGSPQD